MLPSYHLDPQPFEKAFILGFGKHVCYLVLGSYIPAISIAPEYSLKLLQCIFDGMRSTVMPWSYASCNNHMIGSTSLID